MGPPIVGNEIGRRLDGRWLLLQRPEAPDRYFITTSHGKAGDYRAMVGLDNTRGRITLLLDGSEAVVLLGATTAPLV